MKQPNKSDILNIRVTPELKTMLQRIAKFSDRKPTEVAREILEKHLFG